MTQQVLVAAASVPRASVEVLIDFVIVLGLCVVFGLIAERLGQSVIVGYILAGVVVGGPSSFNLVGDITTFSFMGEVGVALLLFTVGLDLPLAKVRRYGTMALVAGSVQVLLTTLAAGAIALAFGADPSLAFVIGAAVSLSSTAVVIRVLADRAQSDSVHGLVTTGVLIAQDVIVLLVLLAEPLLPGADTASGADRGFLLSFTESLLKLAVLVVGVIVVERVVLRRMFRARGIASARELLALSSLVVSLGAIGVCWALELSPALGGFIAGIVMADAKYAPQVRSEIAPIRMGLLAIFFAYVGMLADARWMLNHLPLVVGLVALLVFGKGLLTFIAATIARVPRIAAIMAAAALAQLGEFSFAVLTLGRSVGIVDHNTFRLLVSASVVTLLLTPAVIAGASRTIRRRQLAAGEEIDVEEAAVEQAVAGHAVVVGAGPAGRAVIAALAAAHIHVTVVELNARAHESTRTPSMPHGTRIVFGDASRHEILLRASVQTARILVVTIPDPVAARTIIAQARQLAPDLLIVARGRYNRFVDEVHTAGADDVVDEENVTGMELARVAIRCLEQRSNT